MWLADVVSQEFSGREMALVEESLLDCYTLAFPGTLRVVWRARWVLCRRWRW